MSVCLWIREKRFTPENITLSQSLSSDNKTHYWDENGLPLSSPPGKILILVEKSQRGGTKWTPRLPVQCTSLSRTVTLTKSFMYCSTHTWIKWSKVKKVGESQKSFYLLLHFSYVNNDSTKSILCLVFHSLSIRWGCFGCVMKTNGDVAALQQLCTQPHPSPSDWDLFPITGRDCRAKPRHCRNFCGLQTRAPNCVQLNVPENFEPASQVEGEKVL